MQDLLNYCDSKEPSDDIDHIFNGIYISNWKTSIDMDSLNKHNIKCVIAMTCMKKSLSTKLTYDKHNIKYHHFNIADEVSSNIKQYFDPVNAIIDKYVGSGYNILVHCQEGQSRSPTAVIAYLSKKFKITDIPKLLALVNTKRVVYPNPGFIAQLNEYVKIEQPTEYNDDCP